MLSNQKRKTKSCPTCTTGEVYSDDRPGQARSQITDMIICTECAFNERMDLLLNRKVK